MFLCANQWLASLPATVGINAGMDQEGGGSSAITQLPLAIQDGKVTTATLETAFRRNFRIRIRLGMLDPPVSGPTRP